MEIQANNKDHAIVKSTIELAHNLGMMVVAEGVEDEPLMAVLAELNCDYTLGYHISRPIPFAEFSALRCSWGEPILQSS